jgi:hypothetical protein
MSTISSRTWASIRGQRWRLDCGKPEGHRGVCYYHLDRYIHWNLHVQRAARRITQRYCTFVLFLDDSRRNLLAAPVGQLSCVGNIGNDFSYLLRIKKMAAPAILHLCLERPISIKFIRAAALKLNEQRVFGRSSPIVNDR